MSSKLSVVINTYNEAKILPRAINSIKNIADEIVIVDMESTDETTEVVKKFGAKVFSHKRIDYVEPARNFGISKASGGWILVLDPDEEIGTSLADKIKDVVKKNKSDYYKIPRKNIIFGKWIEHTLWWPDYQIRLFKKGSVNWNNKIHSIPEVSGDGEKLEAIESFAIVHHNYDFVNQYVDKLNRYTTIQSDNLLKDGYKFNWKDTVSQPFKEFVNRYFTGQGYKDGLHGLVLSLMQSFSELVVYAKTWQTEGFKEESIKLQDIVDEMKLKEKDIHYWQNDALYKETGNLTARIKRKLRI